MSLNHASVYDSRPFLCVHDPSASSLDTVLREQALSTTLNFVGWYDVKTGTVTQTKHERFYSYRCLRADTSTPLPAYIQPIDILHTVHTTMKDRSKMVVSDLRLYFRLRKEAQKVVFHPDAICFAKPCTNWKKKHILVIDAHVDEPELLQQVLALRRLKTVIRRTTLTTPNDTREVRDVRARELRILIAEAKMVISSRVIPTLLASFMGARTIYVDRHGPEALIASGAADSILVVSNETQYNTSLQMLSARSAKLGNVMGFQTFIQSRLASTFLQTQFSDFHGPGASIVVACMNREQFLIKALPTWLETKATNIVILDWGSSTPVERAIAPFLRDNRIQIHRVDGVSQWQLTKAYNVAVRRCTTQVVLKVDCDTLLDRHVFDNHKLNKLPVFFSGNWRLAQNENELHTNGVVLFRRADFDTINGYNEFITTYGYDDSDLYERLETFLSHQDFRAGAIQHIPHTDALRTENQLVVVDPLGVEIERNRIIAHQHKWSLAHARAIYYAEKTNSTYLAASELPASTRDVYLQTARVNQGVLQRRIYAELLMGLCNRLRALASMYAIAVSTGRELVIVWKLDVNMQAAYSDVLSASAGPLAKVPVFDIESILNASTLTFAGSFNGISKSTAATQSSIDEVEGLDEALPLSVDVRVQSGDVVFSAYRCWETEDAFLRAIRFADDVEATAAGLLEQYDISSMVGVHVRTGQDPGVHQFEDTTNYAFGDQVAIQRARAAAHVSVFIAKMRSIKDTEPSTRFFVASDNQENISAMQAAFGYNVVVSYSRTVFDRSAAQVKAAAVDLRLLGHTKLILGSDWSSFTEIAARITGAKPLIAGIDF